ncbi:hypothetical protein HOY80DRAFT_978507 [Tuber brumale]|nr:hypothetical protein HOY80DRAFT_978507 [Tuber brumale]
MTSWSCQYCGFGPHNIELHSACIECGRPMDAVEREVCQVVDSANIPPPRPTQSQGAAPPGKASRSETTPIARTDDQTNNPKS